MDDNVTRHLDRVLKRRDWDVLILHYLGLDHIGHISGPHSPLIGRKLSEMDSIVMKIHTSLLSEVSRAEVPCGPTVPRCQCFLEDIKLLKRNQMTLCEPRTCDHPGTLHLQSMCRVPTALQSLLSSAYVSWMPSLTLFLFGHLWSLASSQERKAGSIISEYIGILDSDGCHSKTQDRRRAQHLRERPSF